jgi:hypothetical protein
MLGVTAMRAKKLKITASKIAMLAKLQVTEAEAAAHLGVSLKEFKRMITHDVSGRAAWGEGRANGNISLRRNQFELSKSNASMAQWLGKQWLGQNEVTTIQHTGANGGPIKTLDLSKLDGPQRKALREALVAARVKKPA